MWEIIGSGCAARRNGAAQRKRERVTVHVSLVLVALLLCDMRASAAGLGRRTGNDTLRLPPNASTYRYHAVNAFGDVTFEFPVTVVSPPGDTRMFVVEQGGRIMVIADSDNPRPGVFLDISEKVSYGRPEDEGGLLGLAFHPNFANNGYFFVYYLCNTATSDGTGRHNRLSRFTRSRNDPNKAESGSELVLLSQYDEKFNHNGGTVLFGPDGYLYVSLGDEGHPDDIYDNGQRIDKDFFSAVIRIDVDKRSGNLAPNPHPALGGKVNYFVPRDNPYVGARSFNGQTVNSSRVRTEFYAVGIRSPWRMFMDAPTSTLYLSDVGENEGEEINIISKGGNYGWPYRLGNNAGPKAADAPGGFSAIPPLLSYARGDSGPTVGRAAIGGVVYRGSRFPELNGAYIFGDYYAGNVWMLRHSGNSLQQWEVITVMPQFHLVSFGTDPRNGDILI
jgi:glucose/arabinose dehydrogenase